MKIFLILLALVIVNTSFAKTKKPAVDFNNLITQESQSQTETHKALTTSDIQPQEEGAVLKSKTDKNKIVFTQNTVHFLDVSGKKTKIVKPIPTQLKTWDKLEEDDFSRLDAELNSLQ